MVGFLGTTRPLHTCRCGCMFKLGVCMHGMGVCSSWVCVRHVTITTWCNMYACICMCVQVSLLSRLFCVIYIVCARCTTRHDHHAWFIYLEHCTLHVHVHVHHVHDDHNARGAWIHDSCMFMHGCDCTCSAFLFSMCMARV
jgi:hypothetical protein